MTQTASTVAAEACEYCGQRHGYKCPTVKAYEYHEHGGVKRVEFFAPNDYAPLTIYGPQGTEIRRPWYQDPVVS